LGSWFNTDLGTGGITRMRLTPQGDYIIPENIRAEAWGRCSPTECVWSTYDGVTTRIEVQGDPGLMTVVWKFDYAIITLDLRKLPDGHLRVGEHDHFTDNSGRGDLYNTYDFDRNPRSYPGQ
jgi:hypothetical protein